MASADMTVTDADMHFILGVHAPGWAFRWIDARPDDALGTEIGTCEYRAQRISVARGLSARQTLPHEIGHAVAYSQDAHSADHTPFWRDVVGQLCKVYGIDLIDAV